MIPRNDHLKAVQRLLRDNPVVALIGARQVGKTTLAKEVAQRRSRTHFFDLESSADRARLSDPLLALSTLTGLVVLDEVQRRPELFPTLRVLADRRPIRTRFLVLGSASPNLLRQSSESLAGRIAYYQLPCLSLAETGPGKAAELWLRGGFPRSFTARSHAQSYRWRQDFVATFLERDMPGLGISIPSQTMERFWTMIAHYHAQLWNGSELGRAFGMSQHAMRRYLDTLEATFMVRVLKPWSANLAKRQVKTPKVYIRDSGVLHRLLDIRDRTALERHPKVGASWEGFVMENIIRTLGVEERQCYFWAAHAGAEIDLVVPDRSGRLRGFEIKRTSSPGVTRSMRTAMADLDLRSLDLIHAGDETFPLAKGIRAVAAARLLDDL
ncbi:MAG: ATP-binding protein [Gammaproteobacteria bacterium]|nr:ATP-binding protein [Gammaproteobacteria bacterium]MYK47471.1 ATP-binding protein [Gammaproteobacteria bacterium]